MLRQCFPCYPTFSSVVDCRLPFVFSCFCGGLSFFALFCHVKCYKMKRSLEDSDLTEGHGGKKPMKSLEFDSEDGGAAGTVDIAPAALTAKK